MPAPGVISGSETIQHATHDAHRRSKRPCRVGKHIDIELDALNADWIKAVHWDRVVEDATDAEGLRDPLAEEGDTVDMFKSCHYFPAPAKLHPWPEEM